MIRGVSKLERLASEETSKVKSTYILSYEYKIARFQGYPRKLPLVMATRSGMVHEGSNATGSTH